ncbi:glycerophosphodiester phosphodiesterase [Anaerobacillus isosaccharinicus]|uniref:Glycerophosphodiester phosphodiesterase n=1 Tax=Anaerobacillus isosaccharinicus TaxID=1532552 RepID=A0A1S2LH32_9BACI|nr:glycerophosphodiester phosphodiesterase [Anaerobacillus isosaccharinicus]MBA5586903.1 glycerophosphodiester phosphodiesterase [Anaerobacillus isosaccharinicus]QOY34888.1 glycerophosphodiester phosphodiesterase [Anaerobacillus isosaccharinicus]
MSIYNNAPIYKAKKRRNPVKYIIMSMIFLLLITIIITFPSETKRETKPFFQELETPLVIAHRGGSTYPENTLSAFEHSAKNGADILEFDIHMTKDGHLVAIHDKTVDRTTDGQGAVDSFTLSELKQLDAGYSYIDQNGQFPFRNQGITIPTVTEIFEQFPNSYMNIEIKAQYPDIEQKLWELIQDFNMENNVLIASFNQKIIDQFNQVSGGKAAISGGKAEVTKFVLLHKFFLGNFYRPKVDVIQIPTEQSIFNLVDKKLIRGVSKLNMQLHYWTINEPEEMEKLLLQGADGIITDKPEVLIELIEQLGLK